MNIIKNRVNDVTVLDIQGVIKLGESAREFSSYLEKVLNDETGPVMINFEAINYMDSTGLGELIGYPRNLRIASARWPWSNPPTASWPSSRSRSSTPSSRSSTPARRRWST